MTGWCAELRVERRDFSLDLALEGAATVALIGPNGSGKTTALRVFAGAPIDGVRRCLLRVGDTVLEDTERALGLTPEARRVGYVAQGYALFPHLRVWENVAFGLTVGPRRLPRRARREAAEGMLASVGCSRLANRRVQALSGGERQRVALARSLVIQPKMLLLDEPLAALDAVTRREIRELLVERLDAFAGPTIIATHDARDLRALGAHVVAIEDGRVTQSGTAEALEDDPATPFVAEFFGV